MVAARPPMGTSLRLPRRTARFAKHFRWRLARSAWHGPTRCAWLGSSQQRTGPFRSASSRTSEPRSSKPPLRLREPPIGGPLLASLLVKRQLRPPPPRLPTAGSRAPQVGRRVPLDASVATMRSRMRVTTKKCSSRRMGKPSSRRRGTWTVRWYPSATRLLLTRRLMNGPCSGKRLQSTSTPSSLAAMHRLLPSCLRR